MDEHLKKQICEYFPIQLVIKAWVFELYVRCGQNNDGDIDIQVQFDHEHAKKGLFKYAVKLIDHERLLHREVDFVEYDTLLPIAGHVTNKDKKLMYE